MRISDWSSDVCSSDLSAALCRAVSRPKSRTKNSSRKISASASLIATSRCHTLRGKLVAARGAAAGCWCCTGIAQGPWSPFGGVAVVSVMRANLGLRPAGCNARSEEHTSELQSLMRISYAVFCLKKKTNKQTHDHKQHV